MNSLVWPLGRVVKEDMIASFRRNLAALLAEEAECDNCGVIVEDDGSETPHVCYEHQRKRMELAGF